VIREFFEVLRRKFPHKLAEADHFLSDLNFELIDTPNEKNLTQYRNRVPFIPDESDFDILVSAWLAQPDVLVSGDKKHFHTEEIKESFQVMTPSIFVRTYTKIPQNRFPKQKTFNGETFPKGLPKNIRYDPMRH
jgi:predicted nucleic acid-binding protein